ncbi:MAG TPA: SpoIIE family protein phosphatase [bacterium]|nr:SpoIIE family protein phosphatase [bacterium]
MNNYKKTITILDTDPVNIEILKKIMMTAEDVDIQPYFFKTAQAFYDYLQLNDIPDLCLINATFNSDANCFGVCAYLKKNKITADMPIIFIIDNFDEQVICSIYECGAADYIKMPYNNTEMLMRIKTQLKLKYSLEQLKTKNRELEQINEKYKYELQLAHNVQKNLMLNTKIDSQYYNVDYIYKPYFNIGGDYIDVIKLNNELTAFIIGDIAGHGPATSLKIALLKSFIVTHIYFHNSPSEFLKNMNTFLLENYKKIEFNYLTFFVGFYNHKTKLLYYCSTAQPAPIYFNAKNNTIKELPVFGTPLGLFDITDFNEYQISINPDDKIIIYTDGMLNIFSDVPITFDLLKNKLITNDLIKKSVSSLKAEFYKFIVSKNDNSEFFDDDISILFIEFR